MKFAAFLALLLSVSAHAASNDCANDISDIKIRLAGLGMERNTDLSIAASDAASLLSQSNRDPITCAKENSNYTLANFGFTYQIVMVGNVIQSVKTIPAGPM